MRTHEQIINTYAMMFRATYNNKPETQSNYDFKAYCPWAPEMRDMYGLTLLGNGHNGAAFAPRDADDIVVKIAYGTDDGSAAYITYCYIHGLSGKREPWMPVVHCMYVDPITGFYVAIIERLWEANYRSFEEFSEKNGVVARHHYRYVQVQNNKPSSIRTLQSELGEFSDFRHDNSMQRRNGQIVINDPYMRFNDASIWNPYRVGSPRFIGADYVAEVEALMGAGGKPAIEPQCKSGLPAVQPQEGCVIIEPRWSVDTALLRMQRNVEKQIDEAAEAEAIRAKGFAKLARVAGLKPGFFQLDFAELEQRAIAMAGDAWPKREFVEPVQFPAEPWARRFATNERRQDRWNAIAGNQHWQRKQVPPKPFRG